MITISLCMIVKNEEQSIARCLNSVKGLVDEIVIVDTGSTDKTKQICRQFTDRIFDFEWVDDFSAARNFAFAQATQDYILWLDADDVLSEDDQKKFRKLKETLSPDVDAVSMEYHLSFDAEGKPNFSLRRYGSDMMFSSLEARINSVRATLESVSRTLSPIASKSLMGGGEVVMPGNVPSIY